MGVRVAGYSFSNQPRYGFYFGYGHSFTNSFVPEKVGDPERDHVAATQIAIDSDVEQSEIAEIACEFETRADGSDLFGKKRALLSDEATFVPGSSF